MSHDGATSRPRFPLTGEQRVVLSVERVSVALSAGAGCGKTLVLTEQFLAYLERSVRHPLRALVALTFTEKAARELRERVRRACRAQLDAGADVPHWRSVLRGLEAASIGTFHGFCARVLRRYAVAAGIDPGFTVLEEVIAPSLRAEAVGASIRQALAARDPDLRDLAVAWSLDAVREALVTLLADRGAADLETWAQADPRAVVEGWARFWREKVLPRLLDDLQAQARPCLDFLRANDCSHPKMRERVAFLAETLPRLGECADPQALLAEVLEAARVQGGGGKGAWESEDVYKQAGKQLEQLRESVKKLLEKCEHDPAATLEAAEQGRRLARLAIEAEAAYRRRKQAADQLDFNDLQLRLLRLLREHDEVRDELASTIRVVLVDEFQDTDPVQGEILKLLGGSTLKDGTGQGVERLFLVGDWKQSIYRFRGADPEIFKDFQARVPPEGRHALTENFRSAAGIIDFVNLLFGATYPDESDRLRRGPASPPRDGSPRVEFLWAAEPSAQGSGRIPATAQRKAEAQWLARRLAQRLAQGWIVRDPKTGRERPAHGGDIAILLRALTDAGSYENALAREGLDYHVVGGSAFYALAEIHDLVNLLSAIEDPLDAVALAGLLRSPFCCVSDDALYWLAAGMPRDTASRHTDLVSGFDHHERIDELSPDDRRRVARAQALLRRWRALKDRVPIAELIARAVDESGYEAALMAEFLGDRKRANVRKLIRLARRFDREGGFTLADFVARLRADLRRPPREEEAATTDEEGQSVRLMSIHQAKGLEFPIVVVPDLDRRPGGDQARVAAHPALGLVVRPATPGIEPDSSDPDADDAAGSGKSLGWTAYRALERIEDEAESLRLFYVATTRARDHLILSAGSSPESKPASPAMRLLAERFDRASGRCREGQGGVAEDGLVSVILSCPPRSSGLDRPRSPRPPLLAMARAIERTPSAPRVEPARPAIVRPRFLDLDPARGLPPSEARLDRLVRAILADPAALDPKRLQRAADRAARAEEPAAPPALVARALERLEPFVSGPIGRALARAEAIRRAVSWTVAWPPQEPAGMVVQGSIEFLFRDEPEGPWRVVAVSHRSEPSPEERLRLRLSAHAAACLGIGPVVQGSMVLLGPGGGVHRVEEFGDPEIEAALDQLTAPR